MKTRNILLFPLLFFLISCSANSNQEGDILKNDTTQQTKDSKSADNSLFVKVHSLKKNDNTSIGDIYVKFINDTTFTDLYVIYKRDTLYSIEKSVLTNTKGKDIDVYTDGFYGYIFVLKKNDYFVLSYLRNNGKNISDDITIEWNYDYNILETQKVP